MFQTGHVPKHKNRVTTTEPIRDLKAISDIKRYLRTNPRNLALFTLSINTAFRASDVLNLRHENLKQLRNGCIEITTREKKTGKLRVIVLNVEASNVLNDYIALKAHTKPDDLVFPGQRGNAMGTSYYIRMCKTWIKEGALIDGRFATHSLRKSWTYHQHFTHGVSLTTLMYCLNHSSERQTLTYCGSMKEEERAAYQNSI